jgi:hypothetical protein
MLGPSEITPVTIVTRLGASASSESAIDCLRSALRAAPDYADAILALLLQRSNKHAISPMTRNLNGQYGRVGP